MGQIIFVVAAIAIVVIGKMLNKRMGAVLEDNPKPQEYLPNEPEYQAHYEPVLEVLTPEPMVAELTDYKPSEYHFTYEQLENITTETDHRDAQVAPKRVAAEKTAAVSPSSFKRFPLRDAVIYSEILTPKFKEYN